MKTLIKYTLAAVMAMAFSTQGFAQNAKYKCMLQMTNYKGLEAYVVVSLIAPNCKYENSLYMMGPDKQWYNGF